MAAARPGIALAKQTLRKNIRTTLKALDEVTIKEESEAVTDRLLFSHYYTQANRLSVYLSMPTGELNTDEIVRDALKSGKTVFIPFTKLPKEPHTMKMLRLKSEAELDSLKPNSWGIPEHDTDQDVEEALDDDDGLDLVLMPGVAFDRERNRLGHGKGYYDRYIARLEAWSEKTAKKMPALVALALNDQIVDEEIPTDATDYKPDLVLTPDGQIAGFG